MSDKKFRVGIIGADTQASWAGASHIPALQVQPRLTLAAVATRREESARAAAKAFGVKDWYADPYAMIGEVYASLARDLAAGTWETPGFDHALHNSRLVTAIERAAQTGQRQTDLA